MRKVTLNEICTTVQYGYTASASAENQGPKFLRITDIVPDSISWDEVPHCLIDENDADKYRLHDGDIVIARTGATTGYAKLIHNPPPSVFASYLIRLELDRSLAAPSFVGRLLESHVYKRYVQANWGGAAQPNANAQILTSFEFNLPSLEFQEEVGKVLDDYEYLIETNRRRIQLLEEAARRIYTEWFVRLRFPGHERCKVVNGLPKGWRHTEVGEVAGYVNRGIAPAYTEADGQIVINQKCIRDYKLDFAQARRCQNEVAEEKLVQLGDVLINSTGTGTLGRVAQIRELAEQATVDTHVTIVRPGSGVSSWFFGLQLETMQPHFEQQGEGATNQTELKRDRIRATRFLLPKKEVMAEFDHTVDSMLKQVVLLLRQSEKLQQARDLLLPKLMSGALRA